MRLDVQTSDVRLAQRLCRLVPKGLPGSLLHEVAYLHPADIRNQNHSAGARARGHPALSTEGEVAGTEQDEEVDDLSWSEEWPSNKPSKSSRAPTTDGGSAGSVGRPAFRGLASDATEPQEIDPEALTFGAPRSGGTRERRPPRQASQEPARERCGPTPRTSSRERDATDQNAMAIVARFAENELGGKVRRVDDMNFGWDIEVELDGTTWLIEVKGFAAGSSSFIITRNELRAAESEPNFRVAVVSGVGGRSGSIAFIPDFFSVVDADQLNPMSWSVEDWTRLPHEVRPWTLD
jgi:hypothetical protein